MALDIAGETRRQMFMPNPADADKVSRFDMGTQLTEHFTKRQDVMTWENFQVRMGVLLERLKLVIDATAASDRAAAAAKGLMFREFEQEKDHVRDLVLREGYVKN